MTEGNLFTAESFMLTTDKNQAYCLLTRHRLSTNRQPFVGTGKDRIGKDSIDHTLLSSDDDKSAAFDYKSAVIPQTAHRIGRAT